MFEMQGHNAATSRFAENDDVVQALMDQIVRRNRSATAAVGRPGLPASSATPPPTAPRL
jgi:hypothetical protein